MDIFEPTGQWLWDAIIIVIIVQLKLVNSVVGVFACPLLIRETVSTAG